MRLLALPFFTLRLATQLVFTVIGATLFQLGSKKLWIINGILTLVAAALIGLFIILPPANKPPATTLTIPIEQASMKPVYLSVKTSELSSLLQQYEYATSQQAFIPQYQYINLAILAAATGQSERALQFMELARYIDPNQEIFRN